MKDCKEKKCAICGRKEPAWLLKTVEVNYTVDGQVILKSRKTICPNCAAVVAIELSEE